MRRQGKNISLKQLQMIVGMFIVCPFLYCGITWFLKTSGHLQPADPQVLSIITIVFAVAFLSQVCFAAIFPKMRRVSGADRDALTSYRTSVLVQVALYESGAVFGFVLGFLGAEFTVTLAFCAASVFFLLLVFPTEEKLRRQS